MSNLKVYNFTTGEYEELKVSTRFTELKNNVTLTSDSAFVDIGITSFNPIEDVLEVNKNTVHMDEGIDYILDGGNLRILNPSGQWKTGTYFSFRVLKNVDKSTLPSYDAGLFQDKSITKVKLAQELQGQLDEVVNLRVGDDGTQYSNADARIKAEYKKVNDQLAQKAQQIDNLGATKVNKMDIINHKPIKVFEDMPTNLQLLAGEIGLVVAWEFTNYAFKIGAISPFVGYVSYNDTNTARLRTLDFQPCNKGTFKIVNPLYQLAIWYFSSASVNSYLNNDAKYAIEHTIDNPLTTHVHIVLKRVDNVLMTIEEANNAHTFFKYIE